jgi:hypothetical protein
MNHVDSPCVKEHSSSEHIQAKTGEKDIQKRWLLYFQH